MKIIDEMFRDLQNRIARIARLADEAYKKLHDRCHVRELLEKSRRFEF
jgi:two-component sensor histidine kinase